MTGAPAGRDGYSLDELKQMLVDRAEEMARRLAPDGYRDRDDWVARAPYRADKSANGNFRIAVAGPRRGTCVDFVESQQGFNLLELIRRCIGAPTIGLAAREARMILNIEDVDPAERAEQLRRRERSQAADERRRAIEAERAAKDLAEKRKKAKGLWLRAEPLKIDCPAGLYLAGRGIDLSMLANGPGGPLPGALRFHEAVWCRERKEYRPAMLAAVVDGAGQFVAVHRTYIECGPDGWAKATIERPKKVWPSFAGGWITVFRGPFRGGIRDMDTAKHGPLWIFEGIENGLVRAMTCAARDEASRRVIAAVSVGNIPNLEFPEGVKDLVLGRDDDRRPDGGDNEATAKAIAAAVARFTNEGRTVRQWLPEGAKDAADMLEGDV